MNMDPFAHTVTSEAHEGDFVAGAVNGVAFDTGAFTGTMTITIPTTAPVGTVIPYFCNIHKAAMANRGVVTIVAGP
jgi:hypothetical protein